MIDYKQLKRIHKIVNKLNTSILKEDELHKVSKFPLTVDTDLEIGEIRIYFFGIYLWGSDEDIEDDLCNELIESMRHINSIITTGLKKL